MILKIGDIVVVKGTIFKDSNEYDTRIYGHPTLVLDVDEEMFYYLLIRSKPYGEINIDNYNWKKGKKNNKIYNHKGLKKYCLYESTPRFGCRTHTGYYDLGAIYKKYMYEENDVKTISRVQDTIEPDCLLIILHKLINYQEKYGEDEFYKEIEETIKNYIKQIKYELYGTNERDIKSYIK
ncbi:MAG: hypothetical protein PHT75_03995 [Bacilli bacterium]|nr:hypothetical protein [Bacilli bacterium]MDD3305252.1 hypothetical protein [Bacilli bacterium]MDD4053975.1 hypothetical protein [Bacilli bacterium]MDD4411441.1 hypothetical protein [Bacilli bacterium]